MSINQSNHLKSTSPKPTFFKDVPMFPALHSASARVVFNSSQERFGLGNPSELNPLLAEPTV